MPGAEEEHPRRYRQRSSFQPGHSPPLEDLLGKENATNPIPAGLGCHLWLLEVVTGRCSPLLSEGCVGRPQTAPLLLRITSQEVGLCLGEASPPLTILFRVITTLISHTNRRVQDDVE